MIMNKRFLYGIAVAWMLVLGQFIQESGEMKQLEQTINMVLKEQKVTDICYTVKLVAETPQKTKKEQYEFLYEIAQKKLPIVEETRANGTSLSWEICEQEVQICAQYLDMSEDYIVITMNGEKSEDAFFYMNYFQDLVEEYDLTGIPCMELTAYFPKQLNFMERNVISENLFYIFQANEVDGIRGSDLYTIYGYSSCIPVRMKVAEQWMNLNVSFSLLEKSNQTKLQIGIPIL